MENLSKLIEFLRKAKSFSLTKKILLVVLVVIAMVFALASCTTTRMMSVSVDKAENVRINMTDSVSGIYPTL